MTLKNVFCLHRLLKADQERVCIHICNQSFQCDLNFVYNFIRYELWCLLENHYRHLKQTYWYLQDSNWFCVGIIVKSEYNLWLEGRVLWERLWRPLAWSVLDEIKSEPRSWLALVVIMYHGIICKTEGNIKGNPYYQHSHMYPLPSTHPKLLCNSGLCFFLNSKL